MCLGFKPRWLAQTDPLSFDSRQLDQLDLDKFAQLG